MNALAYPQLIYTEVRALENSVPAELRLPEDAEGLLNMDIRSMVPDFGIEKQVVREMEEQQAKEAEDEAKRMEAKAAVDAAESAAEAAAIAAAAAAAIGPGAAAAAAARRAQEQGNFGEDRTASLSGARGEAAPAKTSSNSASYSAANPFMNMGAGGDPSPSRLNDTFSAANPFVDGGGSSSRPPPTYQQLATGLTAREPVEPAPPKSEELMNMMSFTGADEDTARYYLEESNFDVQKAAQNFWDHKARLDNSTKL